MNSKALQGAERGMCLLLLSRGGEIREDDVWMDDGWMGGWMNGWWMNEWMDGWVDG